MVLAETISPCHFSPTIHSYMGVKHQVTYHSCRVNVHRYDVTIHSYMAYVHKYHVSIHSCTQWCPQIRSCPHCTHNECPVEWCCHLGSPATSTHMMLPSRTTIHGYEQHFQHGMDVHWNVSPTLLARTVRTLSHNDAVNVFDPVPASGITILCHNVSPALLAHTEGPLISLYPVSQWCSQCPWYSAGIRDYHSHDAVNVLDTVLASEITGQSHDYQSAILRLVTLVLRSECCSISWVQRPIYFVSEDGMSSSLWWVEPSLLDPAL